MTASASAGASVIGAARSAAARAAQRARQRQQQRQEGDQQSSTSRCRAPATSTGRDGSARATTPGRDRGAARVRAPVAHARAAECAARRRDARAERLRELALGIGRAPAFAFAHDAARAVRRAAAGRFDSAGSVKGRPTISMPWCRSGSSMPSGVVSWPPCGVLPEVNAPAGLPASTPVSHRLEVPSKKRHQRRRHVAEAHGTAEHQPGAFAQVLVRCERRAFLPAAGTDRPAQATARCAGARGMPATPSMPRATWRASSAVAPWRL